MKLKADWDRRDREEQAERDHQERADREARAQREKGDSKRRARKTAKETTSLGLALIQNPFETVAGMASDRLYSFLINATVDSVMGHLKDKPNPFYDQMADATDKVRARALAGNPRKRTTSRLRR